MAIDIMMPALSPTMEKGTLAKWLVRIGDRVKKGDLLAEIETDKATMEFEAIDDGVVAELIVAEGSEDVPVGTVIARVSAQHEGSTSTQASASPPTQERMPEPSRSVSPPAPDVAPMPIVQDDRASPLALRLAAALGVDLAGLKGSGPNGRIIKSDVIGNEGPALAARQAPPPAAAPAPPPPGPSALAGQGVASPPEGVPHEAIKLSGMRKTIARRLTESKQTVPHFYLSVHCNLDPLLKFRAALNADVGASGVKISVNDLLIKALAAALQIVPEANVQFGGDTLLRFQRVDVAMAVAVPGGLLTPVIRNVGAKALTLIAAESRDLATRAREGNLAPEDYQGGTASISNLGMFGISEMFPVINPPQAMILGIGAGERRPVVTGDTVAPATVMTATASFDHRAIDGAVGAEVMATFRRLIETPITIIV